MQRKILDSLRKWLTSKGRKPLILRGARQVGKTWSVRELAEKENLYLLEINFERNPELGEIFSEKNPDDVCRQLEIQYGTELEKEKTLMFLDEVQSCPQVITNLRWFYEEMPELAIVAAGSLLEFVLEDHDYSMPVGRVSFMQMEPMSFVEFLWAMGEEKLADYLRDSYKKLKMSDIFHKKAMEYLRQYYLVGGMPAVVKAWAEEKNIKVCHEIQTDLMMSYREDFNKYRKKVPAEILRITLNSTGLQLGERFMYSHIDSDSRQPVLKEALNMLVAAKLCKKICHTAGNGLPLGAEVKDKFFKIFALDTGLLMTTLGQQPINEMQLCQTVWAGKGALAEQMVCQLLSAGMVPSEQDIFYWQQSGSGNGEVDFLIQKDGAVTPIEVKAGASGSMKSLHAFMESKGLKKAYRLDINKPSSLMVDVKTNAGKPVAYELISLPIYMAEFLTEE